jgi:hypothetical protein
MICRTAKLTAVSRFQTEVPSRVSGSGRADRPSARGAAIVAMTGS